MSHFTTSLGYNAGDIIKAIAEAQNSKGWSTPSDANTGPIVA